MNPLNDDELNALLQRAKARSPEPSPELASRALHAFRDGVARPAAWRRLLLPSISLPWPVAALIAVLLILIGALSGGALRGSPAGLVAGPQTVNFTSEELRPVLQIRPRVVRSIRDDQ